MSKITIVTKFKNAVGTIVQNFEVPHKDESTGKKVWNKELDYKVDPESTGTTNHLLMNGKKHWASLTYDTSKIRRSDGNAPDEVTIYDIIKSVCEAAPHRVAEGAIKFVVNEDTKAGVLKAIKDNLITKNNNTVTDLVLTKKQASALPDFTADFSDEDINGMADIENEIKKAKKVQQSKIDKELEAQLKD